MCNVHFIYPIKGKIVAEDVVIMKKLLAKASESNKDAYGLTDGKTAITFKGTYAEKEAVAFDSFVGCDFLIGHNRIATQGLTQQPIIYKGVTLAHNGIITGYGKDKDGNKSDSLLWLEEFVDGLEKEKEPNFVEGIKNFLKETYGSYSMAIVYKEQLYYVKNIATSFFMSLIRMKDGRTVIIGDSKFENIEWALSERKYGFRIHEVRGRIIQTTEPDERKLYSFDKEKGKVYVDEIPETKYVSQYVTAINNCWDNDGVVIIDSTSKKPTSENQCAEYYGDAFKNTAVGYYARDD